MIGNNIGREIKSRKEKTNKLRLYTDMFEGGHHTPSDMFCV